MTPKRLRCSVVRCNNEHNSHHLLPKSELLKTQWNTFVCEGNEPPIYLNASMFAKIIQLHLQKKCVRFFNEFLQIAFPDNVLVSKFYDECG